MRLSPLPSSLDAPAGEVSWMGNEVFEGAGTHQATPMDRCV